MCYLDIKRDYIPIREKKNNNAMFKREGYKKEKRILTFVSYGIAHFQCAR